MFVKVDQSNLEAVMRRVNFDQIDRNFQHISEFLCEGKWQFNSLMMSIVTDPPIGDTEFLFEFCHIVGSIR